MKILRRYLVWVVFILLSVFVAKIVERCADSIFISDQLELAAVLISKHNPIALFWHILPPHRQGFMFIIWGFLQSFIGLDARISAWMAFITILCATYVAIKVLRKITAPSLVDFVIPLSFISLKLHETLVGVPNPSHGPAPLLLFFLLTVGLLMPSGVKKGLYLSLIIFLMAFSGFGLVILPVAAAYATILLLRIYKSGGLKAIQGFSKTNSYPYIILAGVLLSSALFLHGYKFYSAVDCFSGGVNITSEMIYVSLIAAHLLGYFFLNYSSLIVGLLFLLILTLIFVRSGYMILHSKNKKTDSQAIDHVFFGSGFSVVFILLTAYGRGCLGLKTAFASRYLIYLLPGIWATLIYLKSTDVWPGLKTIWKKHLLIFFAILLINVELRVFGSWFGSVLAWHNAKQEIARCFRGDQAQILGCVEKTGVAVFPNPERAAELLQIIYKIPKR